MIHNHFDPTQPLNGKTRSNLVNIQLCTVHGHAKYPVMWFGITRLEQTYRVGSKPVACKEDTLASHPASLRYM